MEKINVVKTMRTGRGLSQEELAKMAGISADTVRRIENNRGCPSIDTMYKIALALNAPDLIFMGRDTTLRAKLRELANNAAEAFCDEEYDEACNYVREYDSYIENNRYILYGRNGETYSNENWIACVKIMLELTAKMYLDDVDGRYIMDCDNGIKIGGFTEGDFEEYTPIHLTDPVKQLLNIKGLAYMRLNDYENASKIFESLFLCLEYDGVMLGVRENLRSQMAAVKCNQGYAEYGRGNMEKSEKCLREAFSLAMKGASAKRCGHIIELMSETGIALNVCDFHPDDFKLWYSRFTIEYKFRSNDGGKRVTRGILML